MGGKIVFCVPLLEDEKLVRKIFNEQNDAAWELETLFIRGDQKGRMAGITADAIIARGITWAVARKMLKEVPVIELPITGYDIIRAIGECRDKYQTDRIAVVGTPGMINGVKTIERLVNISIEPFPIIDEDQAKATLLRIQASGISTVIGGGTVSEMAAALAMNAVLIHCGQEAIFQALAEAKRVILIRRKEMERAEQFRSILDFSLEGIVAVDENGCLNLINKAASDLVGITEKDIGRKAGDVVSKLHLDRVLESGQAELGLFEALAGRQVAVNCVPIIIKDRPAGAIATFQPVKALQELEGKIRRRMHIRRRTARFHFRDIISNNGAMRRIIGLAEEYSRVDSSVLILGETGTGKEVFAQSIHNAGNRRHGPWIPVNCAALPESLLESELFGYVEGAFTGAVKGGKIGLFEQAHHGTLFLDEIAEISPKIQGQLLRVIQEREIMRLGDERLIPIDVRLIAATNRDLRKMVKEGQFRADLYYRLDVLQLQMPPLRRRKEDILPMLQRFMKSFAARFQTAQKELTPQAQELLVRYNWPGNVRELLNITERLTVLGGYTLDVLDEEAIQSILCQSGPEAAEAPGRQPKPSTMKTKQLAQRDKIISVLEQTNYHYGRAAEQLGMSRTTLWRRLSGKDSQGRVFQDD